MELFLEWWVRIFPRLPALPVYAANPHPCFYCCFSACRWQGLVTACLFFLFCQPCLALPGAIYESQGGNGSLTIAGSSPVQSITIATIGANGHTCSFNGSLKKNLAFDDAKTGGRCTMRVQLTAERTIEVDNSSEGCKNYCGLRASMEGTYIHPLPNCSVMARQARKNQFAQQFNRRDFNAAFVVLQQFYTDCGALLNWIEKDEVLNDLAITAYRLRQPQLCRQLLSQTLAARHPTRQALNEEISYPIDIVSYEATAKAVRTNMYKCRLVKAPLP